MKSVALKFDLIDDAISSRSTMGLYRDGAAPTAANAIGREIALDPLGISLLSGHQFRVTVSYDGAALTAVLRDQDLHFEITRSFLIDIPAITGAVAHVGFTAGTGFLSANQDILSWQFSTTAGAQVAVA